MSKIGCRSKIGGAEVVEASVGGSGPDPRQLGTVITETMVIRKIRDAV